MKLEKQGGEKDHLLGKNRMVIAKEEEGRKLDYFDFLFF